MVDYIIPYSELAKQFQPIARSLGVKKALPLENASKIKKDLIELPEALIASMRAFYAEDYALMEQIGAVNERGLLHLAAITA